MAPDQVRLGFTRGDLVIVTGAASGIGKATALSAAAVGLRVAAWDLNGDGAEATAGNIRDMGGDALAVCADVTDDGQMQAALDASEKAAIMGYTRHLAAYRYDEVRTNAVAPGMTDTPRLAGFTASDIGQRALQRIPAGRLARPDEIAWAILFLLSPLAS